MRTSMSGSCTMGGQLDFGQWITGSE